MEIDKNSEDEDRKNDKKVGQDQKVEEMAKTREELWSEDGSFASEARGDRSRASSYGRSSAGSSVTHHAEPRSHGHPRPKKGKAKKKKAVLRGRVDKRANKVQLKVQTKQGAVVKRKLKPVHHKIHHRLHHNHDYYHRSRSIASDLTSISTLTAHEREDRRCARCGRRHRSRVLSPRSRRLIVNKIVRSIRRNRDKMTLPKISVDIQAGAAANVLSPLLVKTNAAALQSHTDVHKMPAYAEVTPEMIVECLRCLTMWSQAVDQGTILNYMKRNYPVNPDNAELMAELSAKLRIAAELNFITQVTPNGHWSLSHAMQKHRKLKKNHVELFWKMYSERMALPLRRNRPENTRTMINQEENNTSGVNSKII